MRDRRYGGGESRMRSSPSLPRRRVYSPRGREIYDEPPLLPARVMDHQYSPRHVEEPRPYIRRSRLQSYSPRRTEDRIGEREYSPRRGEDRTRGPENSPRRVEDRTGRVRYSPRRGEDRIGRPGYSPRRGEDRIGRPGYSPRRIEDRIARREYSPRHGEGRTGRHEFSPMHNEDRFRQRDYSPRRRANRTGAESYAQRHIEVEEVQGRIGGPGGFLSRQNQVEEVTLQGRNRGHRYSPVLHEVEEFPLHKMNGEHEYSQRLGGDEPLLAGRIPEFKYSPKHPDGGGQLDDHPRDLERPGRDFDRHLNERDRSRRDMDHGTWINARALHADSGNLRRPYESSESLAREDANSSKFQWNHPLDDPRLDNSIAYGDTDPRVISDRDYLPRKSINSGPSGFLTENIPVPEETQRGRLFSSYGRHERDAEFARRIHGNESGGGSTLDMEFRGTSLWEDGAYRSGGPYKDEKPLDYAKYASEGLSSHSTAFQTISSSLFKEHATSSYREDVQNRSDGARLAAGVATSDSYGHRLSIRSPLEHDRHLTDKPSYSQSYVPLVEQGGKDFVYPEVGGRERNVIGLRFGDLYGRVTGTGLEYNSPDILRTNILDPIADRRDDYRHQEHQRDSRPQDHVSSSLARSTPDYLGAYMSYPSKSEMVVGGSGRNPFDYEREAYLGSTNDQKPDIHRYEADGAPWRHHKESDLPILDELGHSSRSRLALGEMSTAEPSRMPLQRRYGKEKISSQERAGNMVSRTRRNIHKADRGDIGGSRGGNDLDFAVLSRRLKPRNPKSINRARDRTNRQSSMRTSRDHGSGRRDVKKRLGPTRPNMKSRTSLKKRLGPGAQKNHGTLPWLKNLGLNRSSGNHDASDESHLKVAEEPLEVDINNAKPEPAANSEDFKQLVQNAFFKFVKQLNATPLKRRKYMEHGNAGSLKCNACGRDSEEFADTESLAMHAFTCTKPGLRSQHLGFHRALCVLMGWRSTETPDGPWICETISNSETMDLKEDLILWPPVVIIHNSSITSKNPDERVVISNEEMEAKLKDLGFKDKTKVSRGKPANQSIMVVKFAGTFSGLRDAERLARIYNEQKHGRVELKKINSNSVRSHGETQPGFADKLDGVLYGYLGIAEDLDKLDFETKKRSVVKSKKEILSIADAPLKHE